MTVTVVGWDGSPLDAAASVAVRAASLVVGGARHLTAVADLLGPGAETVTLGDLGAGLDALTAHAGTAVVVASGDPGFFGIVRALRRRGVALDVRPARSSVSLAFARAGLSWDDAVVVSAHGRTPHTTTLSRAVNVCRAHHTVAVLTAPGSGPAHLGAALAGVPRRMFVAQDLGSPDERTTWCTPDEAAARDDWRDPNVVLVIDPDHGGTEAPSWAFPGRVSPTAWALDESAFDHRDSMISKAEVRAAALARLGPGLGDLIWDVGAGSGSVAVECARFGAAVVAVDRDPAAVERITANAAAHSVRVETVLGDAPGALSGLPSPDAVFVGGGGPDVVTAVAQRSPRAVVVALAAVDRVRPTWDALQAAGYDVAGTQLASSRLAPLPGGALRLAATNPVFLVWGHHS